MTSKRTGSRSGPGILMIILMVFLLCGCSSTPSASPPSGPGSSQDSTNGTQLAAWNSDGMVSANEYTQSKRFGDLEMFTRLGDGVVHIAIQSKKEGYLSLGIRPEEKMMGGDIITCVLDGTKATIYDTYAIGTFGPHPDDINQSGSYDIMEGSGSRQNGVTTFEFKRRLDTGDKFDKALVVGNNPIMWAIGSSVDRTTRHSSRGFGDLVIK